MCCHGDGDAVQWDLDCSREEEQQQQQQPLQVGGHLTFLRATSCQANGSAVLSV